MADPLERFTFQVNTVLLSMSLLPWSTMDHVGECSSYTVQLAMLFEQERVNNPSNSKEYVKTIGTQWCQSLFMLSWMTTHGAQQMIVDLHALKARLVELGEKKLVVDRSFSRLECILKFISASITEDANVMCEFYFNLFVDTDVNFYGELLRLKGVDLANRLRLTNSFERNWSQNPSYFATSKVASFFVDLLF